MNEREKARQELKDQFPEWEWPNVRMEVPEHYWQESKAEVLQKATVGNDQSKDRRLIFTLVSLAAAIAFLVLIWNTFQAKEREPLAGLSEQILEQYLLETSTDFNEEDWAFLLSGEPQVEWEAVDLELSEKDWNTILEEWPYDLNESTIYELQNQIQ